MRVAIPTQLSLDEVDIGQIQFDLKSRDDIPRILRGLQQVYLNETLREQIFALLDAKFQPQRSKTNGRPGMALWHILVLGVVRLDLNEGYDRLHELANQHITLRLMLGCGPYNETEFHYQTLMDNVSLLSPELLEEINTLIVNEGHVIAKKGDAPLRGRCDSFVVETNVHYPTDITLLLDAMRKAITLIARQSEAAGKSEWRQYSYNINSLKRQVRACQRQKRRKNEEGELSDALKAAHQTLLDQVYDYLRKIELSEAALALTEQDKAWQEELKNWKAHAVRQLDQIERRVIKGETIPHGEKVFSIFEPHTEWISKGKAGVPVELGVRVCVMEDQYQFILHHRVMTQETDDKVAVSMVKDTQYKFKALRAVSFDKGFHSPANQTDLLSLLDNIALPRKGRLSVAAREHEQSESFIRARRQHPAVESDINALEVHGLDRCPDKGITGFKRYVALAVLARNIHRIGDLIWQQDLARERRRRAAIQGHQNRLAA